MGQGRNNDDRCFYAFHQLMNFKLFPLFNYSNFNFHLDLLFILFKQIIVHIYTLHCLISLRLMSLPHFGPGSSSPYCCCCCLSCCFCCCLCYCLCCCTSKIVAHISGWRVSIIVELGPPNLGKEELGSNDLDQVASTEEGSGWPFFHVGLKTASKG